MESLAWADSASRRHWRGSELKSDENKRVGEAYTSLLTPVWDVSLWLGDRCLCYSTCIQLGGCDSLGKVALRCTLLSISEMIK
jgi:hypothetical protein